MATELARYFETTTFLAGEEPTDAAIWFFVKGRPGADVITRARQAGVRTVYAPIDFYGDERQLSTDPVLKQFDLVLAHSNSLFVELCKHCSRVERVEHHVKYGLPEIRTWKERKPDDRISWIGNSLSIPTLIAWLREHDRDLSITKRITLLTDRSAYDDHPETRMMKVLTWSEKFYQLVLRSTSAVIDIRGSDFDQRMKPPTKAQQYVWSGVTTAMNPDSGSSDWFREHGFELCDPRDQTRWFSKAYWEETCAAAAVLRRELTLEAVGARYRDLLLALAEAR
jgi:hypothetical protein